MPGDVTTVGTSAYEDVAPVYQSDLNAQGVGKGFPSTPGPIRPTERLHLLTSDNRARSPVCSGDLGQGAQRERGCLLA